MQNIQQKLIGENNESPLKYGCPQMEQVKHRSQKHVASMTYAQRQKTGKIDEKS